MKYFNFHGRLQRTDVPKNERKKKFSSLVLSIGSVPKKKTLFAKFLFADSYLLFADSYRIWRIRENLRLGQIYCQKTPQN